MDSTHQTDIPGRVRRFNVADRVTAVRGGLDIVGATVRDWVSDPLHPPGWSHCVGCSARYRVDGYDDWVYDWMLEAAA